MKRLLIIACVALIMMGMTSCKATCPKFSIDLPIIGLSF